MEAARSAETARTSCSMASIGEYRAAVAGANRKSGSEYSPSISGDAFAREMSMAGGTNLALVGASCEGVVDFGDIKGEDSGAPAVSFWVVDVGGPPCSEVLPQRKSEVNLLLGDLDLTDSSMESNDARFRSIESDIPD